MKLAAPMLGTTYDSLKQRHKVRLLQRLSAAACLLMLFTGAFSAYAIYQNRRIAAALKNSMISESKNLARQSEELLFTGRRYDSIRSALSALPTGSGDKSRPVVPEAVHALNNAVYSYRKAMPNQFFQYSSLAADAPFGSHDLVLSPDGRHIAGLDGSGRLCLFDAKKETPLLYLRPFDIDPSDSTPDFLCIDFLDDSRLLLVSTKRLYCMDFSAGTVLWSAEFHHMTDDSYSQNKSDSLGRFGTTRLTVSRKNNSAIIVSSVYPELVSYVFNCSTGNLIQSRAWSGTGIPASCVFSSPVLSPGENFAAFGLWNEIDSTDTWTDSESENIPGPGRLLILSLKDLDLRCYSCRYSNISSVYFPDNRSAVVLSATAEEDNGINTLENIGRSRRCCLEQIDLSDLSTSWRNEETVEYEGSPKFFTAADPAASDSSSLLLMLGRHLSCIDVSDGRILGSLQLPDNILEVCRFSDNRFLVCLCSGSIYQIAEENGIPSYLFCMLDDSGDYTMACGKSLGNTKADFFLKESNGNHIVITGNTAEDDSYTALDLSGYGSSDPQEASSCECGYFTWKEQSWRYVRTYSHLLLYRPLSDTPAADIPVSSLETTIGFLDNSDEPIFYYIDKSKLYGFNMKSSEIVLSEALPELDSYTIWIFLGWYDNTAVLQSDSPWLQDKPVFCLIDTVKGSAVPIEAPSEEGNVLKCAFRNQTGIIAAVTQAPFSYFSSDDEDSGYRHPGDSLWFYEISSGTWRRSKTAEILGLQASNYGLFDRDGIMSISPGGNTLAVTSGGTVKLLDLPSDSIRGILNCSCLKHCVMDFIDENRLVIWDDSRHISVWNISDNTLLCRTENEHWPKGVFISPSLEITDTDYLSVSYTDHLTCFKTAVYQITESGSLIPYLDLDNAIMSPSAEEVLYVYSYGSASHTGFYRCYTLDELIGRAENLIGTRNAEP